MYAVRDRPLNRPAFKGERAASHQEIFDSFRNSITAMSNEAMKTHSYPEAAGHPVENDRADERAPAPKEWSGEGGDVPDQQEDSRAPIDLPKLLPSRHSNLIFNYLH
jgi:hypothetical protein